MYSVRQYLWKLGQGDNIILAVISTLFCPEMELISVRFPRSKGETEPSRKRSRVVYMGQPEASAATHRLLDTLEHAARCSTGLRGRWTECTFPWKGQKAPEFLLSMTCLSLSKRIHWANTVVFQLFFPRSRTFPLNKNVLQLLSYKVNKSRAALTRIHSSPSLLLSHHLSPPPPSTPNLRPLLRSLRFQEASLKTTSLLSSSQHLPALMPVTSKVWDVPPQ